MLTTGFWKPWKQAWTKPTWTRPLVTSSEGWRLCWARSWRLPIAFTIATPTNAAERSTLWPSIHSKSGGSCNDPDCPQPLHGDTQLSTALSYPRLSWQCRTASPVADSALQGPAQAVVAGRLRSRASLQSGPPGHAKSGGGSVRPCRFATYQHAK